MPSYFVRYEHGQKGPYTLKQLRAGIRERSLSADGEYRKAGEEAWRPLADLRARLEQEDAAKLAKQAERRAERIEQMADITPPGAPEQQGKGGAAPGIAFVVLLALAGGGLWWTRNDRIDAMGKPCRAAKDCPSKGTCLFQVDENRNVEGGYCTFPCDDSSDCHPSMYCGKAVETGPQGAKWDGTFGKKAEVCLKR